MKKFFFALCLCFVICGCDSTQAVQGADAGQLAQDRNCLDEAWELHNWTMVLHDGIEANDLTLDDIGWISRQMDYHAGVFRVCAQ